MNMHQNDILNNKRPQVFQFNDILSLTFVENYLKLYKKQKDRQKKEKKEKIALLLQFNLW